LTEAELWAGIKASHTPKDYEELLAPFKRYCIDVAIARRAGELSAPLGATKVQRIPGIADCILAATAEHHGLTVCSRNTQAFSLFSTFSIQVVYYRL
jgi:predicted nucleic acid-binding protein